MLNSRFVMIASGATLGVAGVACLFAPVETLSLLGFPGADATTGQILGATYLGLAAANWTARGSMIGVIYARPLSLGNFVHFLIGAIVLAKGISIDFLSLAYAGAAFVYLVFAILFGLLVFGRLERVGSGP
jgi:hypothetical protein